MYQKLAGAPASSAKASARPRMAAARSDGRAAQISTASMTHGAHAMPQFSAEKMPCVAG